MKTTIVGFIRTGLSLMAIAIWCSALKAQSVQEGSVWAPANIKIDAKLTEWNNTLQAYNRTTLLNYTIANDEKNLYLVIKSSDPANNNKITAGGITFTINTAGKKKDKDAFVVTYPVISRASRRGQFRQRGSTGRPDSAAISNMRTQLLSTAKEINLTGFKDITDSTISIYNEYGIKAAVGYDANGSFIYELALPLKLLGLTPESNKEIAYNIKVNGFQFGGRNRQDNGDGQDNGGGFGDGGAGRRNGGGFGGGGNRGGGGGFGGGNFNMQDMFSPTDFWGKYSLAKK